LGEILGTGSRVIDPLVSKQHEKNFKKKFQNKNVKKRIPEKDFKKKLKNSEQKTFVKIKF